MGGGWIFPNLLRWRVLNKWKWVMKFSKICSRGSFYCSVPKSIPGQYPFSLLKRMKANAADDEAQQ